MVRLLARSKDSRLMLWLYLILFAVAEVLTTLFQVQFGIVLYAIILLTLPVYAGMVRRNDERNLALALTVVPTVRLLSLSIPLPELPQLSWYPIISIQLLFVVWLLARYIRVGPRALGLNTKGLWLQIMLAGIGIPLGIIEYAVLQPNSLIPTFSWMWVIVGSLTLIVFTGFTEELIFRGLLQRLSLSILGRYALVFVSLLFAILHIGYRSASDVAFVFAVGLLFAYIVYWSDSIVGVTLAHSLTNIMLFLVMPMLVQQYPQYLQTVVPLVIWVTLILTCSAVTLLILRAGNRGKLQVEDLQITQIRELSEV